MACLYPARRTAGGFVRQSRYTMTHIARRGPVAIGDEAFVGVGWYGVPACSSSRCSTRSPPHADGE